MSEDQDDSQKTEEPTQRRLEEARKKGQVPSSREMSSFMMMLIMTAIILWLAPWLMKVSTHKLVGFIDHPHVIDLSEKGVRKVLIGSMVIGLSIIILPLLLSIVAAIAASFVQHGFLISFDSLEPKLERISVLAGIKRLFSARSLVELLKGIVKISIVAVVAYMAVHPLLPTILVMHSLSMKGMLGLLAAMIKRMLIGICIVLAFIGVADFLYQRYEYIKNMRMSRQDIKDEMKQSEGDPEIKAKLRAIRNERSRKRMMAAVPTADVIITNPTHYSIALMYDRATMKAPRLVAKGVDMLAMRIREVAKENDVPIMRNPPLARALYDTVKLDEEIPEKHYQAVAEIISYVYRLKGKIA